MRFRITFLRRAPIGAALYLRFAPIEPPEGVSTLAGDDRSRGRWRLG